MKVHLLLIFLFGILNAFALTDKHEEERYELRTKLANRIIGGKEAGKNEFPWMATMMHTKHGSYCGGTLFTLRNVLTAAHCFSFGRKNLTAFRIELAKRYVILGNHYLNITEYQEQIFGIDDMLKLYPDYNRQGLPLLNDLAVLKLNGTATINRYVSTICLAKYPVYPGDRVTIIGWGLTEEKTYHDKYIVLYPNASNVLKVAETKVLRREECTNYHQPNDKNGNMVLGGQRAGDDMICIYDENDDASASNGDSGGPMLYYDPIEEQYEQVGICDLAFGRSGEQQYANVPFFREKILEMVTEMDRY